MRSSHLSLVRKILHNANYLLAGSFWDQRGAPDDRNHGPVLQEDDGLRLPGEGRRRNRGRFRGGEEAEEKSQKAKGKRPISIFFLNFADKGFLAFASVLLLYGWVCLFQIFTKNISFFIVFFTSTMQNHRIYSADNDSLGTISKWFLHNGYKTVLTKL